MYPCILELVVAASVIIHVSTVQCLVSTHSDNIGHSKYLITCCDPENSGKNIITEGDNGAVNIFLCPSTTPLNCPVAAVVHGPSSCRDILNMSPNSTSGYHSITLYNGSVISVYCDMEGANCDSEGGWTRIGYINMSATYPESGSTCPGS